MRHKSIGIGVALGLALVVQGFSPVTAALKGWTTTAFAQDAKATEILAAARKAIGDNKLDALKALSVQASIQRNMANMQMQTESEILLELPDRYVKSDVSSGPMSMTMSTGFNGDKAILPAGASAMPGGGMMIRMGGGGAAMADPHGAAEKPTPEQQEQMNRAVVRNARHDISRLMLGWQATAHPSLKAQYTYAGEAESPDGKAYVIDVKDDDGFAARLFIDQNSKLPLMLTYKGRLGRMVTSTARQGGSAPPADVNAAAAHTAQPPPLVDFSLFFEDWRQVDGINFPHVIRRASEGATNEEWKVNKVKVNPKLDANKFAVETR